MIADNTPAARSNIPEDWLIGMTCPVCGDTHLTIEREITQPDQLFCRSCMTLFEMSQDMEFIRLVRAPSNLPSDMASRWVKPASVGRMAYQYAQHTDALITLTDDNLSLEDRVKALIRLHNSPDKIREILYRLPGVSIEKVEEAIANANQQKSKRDPAWTIALGVGVLLLVLTLVVVLITLPGQQELPTSLQPTTASNSFLDRNCSALGVKVYEFEV